ncbi:MAG: hypothetical protein LBG92_02305, partial [Prevotellaceae bacterium]|nr:hypothetical protein [Prevotellaceae bacterium]
MRIRSKNVLKGQNFRNRRRAIALPAALRKRGTCPNGQNASVVFVLPIRAGGTCTFRCPQATLRSPAVM